MSDYYPGSVEDDVTTPETESVETPETQPTTPEETMFDVAGQQTGFSKLTQDNVKEWYEAFTNKNAWQKSNTDKAQEIAGQRKEVEDWNKSHPDYEKKLKNYNIWDKYLIDNPLLQQVFERYMKDPNSRNAFQQTLEGMGESPRVQPVRDPYYDQRLTEYEKKLQVIEADRQREKEDKERQNIDAERQTAIDALKLKDPNLNIDEFSKFMSKVGGNQNNLSDLYNLLYEVYVSRSKGQIQKDAQKEVLDNIKKKQSSAVETGSTTPAVTLPENVEVGEDLDTIFDKIGKNLPDF